MLCYPACSPLDSLCSMVHCLLHVYAHTGTSTTPTARLGSEHLFWAPTMDWCALYAAARLHQSLRRLQCERPRVRRVCPQVSVAALMLGVAGGTQDMSTL